MLAGNVWSLRLTAGQSRELTPTCPMRLTNAAIFNADSSLKPGSRTVVTLTAPTCILQDAESHRHDIQTLVLGSFIYGQGGHFSTSLILEASQPFTFNVVGPGEVYLSGNFIDVPRESDGKPTAESSLKSAPAVSMIAPPANLAAHKDQPSPRASLKRPSSSQHMDRQQVTQQVTPPNLDKFSFRSLPDPHRSSAPTHSLRKGKEPVRGSLGSMSSTNAGDHPIAPQPPLPMHTHSFSPPSLPVTQQPSITFGMYDAPKAGPSGLSVKARTAHSTSGDVVRPGQMVSILFIQKEVPSKKILKQSVDKPVYLQWDAYAMRHIPGLAEGLGGMRVGEERVIDVFFNGEAIYRIGEEDGSDACLQNLTC
ncbi:hypothetical protein ONZ45_g15849 [Pleurotus djamor]|nr:hypothetical protein ONZ45_g15849 [Pleurotus djamor]